MTATKVRLDVDPGIGDAVAICLALFDPQLEVVAVTSVGGPASACADITGTIAGQVAQVTAPT